MADSEQPDPRQPQAGGPQGPERRASVPMYGALTVIPGYLHDMWCVGGWPLTRLATARNLAVCPGCACAVQVD